MSLVIKALKNRYRYPFRGEISTEELFTLSEKSLDQVYSTLNKELSEVNTGASLLSSSNPKATEIEEKMQIVKYIFDEKREENRIKEVKAVKSQQQREILEIIEKKRQQALLSKSEEELLAQYYALNPENTI